MRLLTALIGTLLLASCSESYRDLDRAFGQDETSNTPPIAADSFFITNLKHQGVTSFHGIAKVRVSPGRIELTPGAPFMRSLSIPASNIAYCGMTCFGTSDPRVDLLIPRTGSSITVKNKREMLDWCWDNKKAVISGADERNWEYKGGSLPPQSKYAAQLDDRTVFEKQAYQSCLGY
ncbi:hypothetical protein [Lysobacter sp. CFH 32150]|uniref:hypothetical protein n=1 Tax=Lysobacter sp. CFH 32150 TaxID=2927128 RepID=UPI001FA7BDEB|nr:hypothetical protein [Lysobacter sp. CFH 32150]MCI4567520.1 hypothetical protein [Lysobacter sp. CFH 32150]